MRARTTIGLRHIARDGALAGLMVNTLILSMASALVNSTSSLFLADAIGATPLMIGLFFTGRGVLEVGGGLTLGALSDRTGNRRLLMTICPFLSGIGAVSYLAVRDYYLLLATGALFFALGGAGFAQIFAYDRDFARSRELNPSALNAVLRSITSACWVVGPPLAFLLIDSRGFGTLYFLAAVLYLTSSVLCRWLLPDLSHTVDTTAARGKPFAGVGRPLWLLVAVVLLMLTVNNMYQIDIALFVTRTLGYPATFTGLLLGLAAALEVVVLLLVGRHADRIGKWRLLGLATACATLFFVAQPFAHSRLALVALQLPNAFWTSTLLSVPIILLQDGMGHRFGVASSLFTGAYQVGILLSGALTGVVAEWAGFGNVFFACAALSLVATALVAAARTAARTAATPPASADASTDPATATL